MKKQFSGKTLLFSLLLFVPLVLLVNYLLQPSGVARGKSASTPLTDQLTDEQQLAQELALSDARVLGYTAGKRTEVFGVREVGMHFPPSASACGTAKCRQVEIYSFDEDAAITAIVNVDSKEVLEVFYQPGVQPGINKRLADIALDIAMNNPDVINALGFKPTRADMAPVESGFTGTVCDTGHLCVGPNFELGDRILWAIVDLTDEKLIGINWTVTRPNPPNNFVPFTPEGGCPAAGTTTRDGWDLDYQVTGTDGLRIYNVTYNGVPVITSAKAIEWHADYGSSGYTDYTGCGGGGGGFHISPYGDTQVLDILDDQSNVIGFDVVQDFRMFSWGNFCNYRYEQHFQFYTDGRFRVVGGAYGKGCGENAIYRPLIRIDIAVNGDSADSFSIWDGTDWQSQATENWWLQAAPYTLDGYKWQITDETGAGYYLEPGQNNNFGDEGRGDNAFFYVTQHHSNEGDTDLGIIGTCCNDTYQQGPHIYLNNESISNQNLVVWYVPQLVTDAVDSGNGYYCWTISGEPNPETYPCFGGPMFIPTNMGSGANIGVNPSSLSSTQGPDSSVVLPLEISNTGNADLSWFMFESGVGLGGNFGGALDLSLVEYENGFDEPVDIAHAGDERLFIVEKDGVIRIIDGSGNMLPTAFLNINSRVGSGGSEQGLLGLAFHPNYTTNDYFYVNYTNNSGDTVISRFSVTGDPNVADPNSELILLTIDQPYSNHNGGNLEFGADGYLYIGMGDGGSSGDPQNRAQNGNSLLGKMLRIDVDGGSPYAIPADNPFVNDPSVLDEIWALGLRNPWRFSFDRFTGDLWIGDVGQNVWEEVNFQPADSTGGENYGWRCYEGNHNYNTTGCGPMGDYDGPIFEYSHGSNCSETGGYVYRGSQYANMYGHYLVADYCSGNFWSIVPNGANWTSYAYPGLADFGVSSFGEGSDGELYVANISNGRIYHVQENTPIDDLAWLSADITGGVVPASGMTTVQITFNSAGLLPGSYSGNLWIGSNDADTPLLAIPVNLTVESSMMRSVGIGGWGRTIGGLTIAKALAVIQDSNNMGVAGAEVHVTWTKPNGSTVDQIGTTGGSGVVWFQTGSASTGAYIITITDIVKPGYTFDEENSVLTKTITVP